jgi:hypothetical protein
MTALRIEIKVPLRKLDILIDRLKQMVLKKNLRIGKAFASSFITLLINEEVSLIR